MIYDSSKASTLFAARLFDHGKTSSSEYGINECKIVVYSGEQPTTEQYETNWSSDYWLNLSNTATSSNVLCGYGKVWNSGANVELGISSSNIYLSSTVHTSHYFNDGVATWAVIYDRTNYLFTQASLTITSEEGLTDLGYNMPSYMIVPVTDLAGNGVIKLSTTLIANTEPLLGSVNLLLTLGD